MPVADSSHALLVTAPTQARPDYHLLELTPDLLSLFERSDKERSYTIAGSTPRGTKRQQCEHVASGEQDANSSTNKRSNICIKGRHDDEAVLCTETQTYVLRQVTQSNSLLLCTLDTAGKSSSSSSRSNTVTVRNNLVETYELIPTVARVGRIATILRESSYAGDEEDGQEKHENGMLNPRLRKRYTLQQLASVVQASIAELKAALCETHVVDIDGYVRMMDDAYLARAIHVLLAHMDKLNLLPDRILLGPAVAVLNSLHDMRREAAEAMLCQWFGQVVSENDEKSSSNSGTETIVSLRESKLVQFVGLQLLKTEAHDQPVPLKAFLEKWKDSVGTLLSQHVDIQTLDGDYLLYPEPPAVATKLAPAHIQHFASAKLSLDVSQRFKTLFTKRAQWTAEALTPFLRDVAIDAKKRDALLLKFARSSHVRMPVEESKQERRARLMSGNPHAPTQNVQLYSARLRYG